MQTLIPFSKYIFNHVSADPPHHNPLHIRVRPPTTAPEAALPHTHAAVSYSALSLSHALIVTAGRDTAAMFPRIRSMNPLKLFPLKTNISYDRLPGYESATGSPFNGVSLKKYRWRSPSPGAERFPVFVKMSLSRLLVLAITSILCVGLIAVGGYRGHRRLKHQPPPAPKSSYPWEKFTRYHSLNFQRSVRLTHTLPDLRATTTVLAHLCPSLSGRPSRSSFLKTLQ